MARRRPWSAADVECLRRWYADVETTLIAQALGRPVRRILAKANQLGLHKSVDLVSAMAKQRTADPCHPSHNFRFKPGIVPWNTGTTGLAGQHEASRATQFKPGSKPHTTLPVGSLRVNEGTLERKMTEEPGPYYVRWRPVHQLVWIQSQGPIPNGFRVVFKPGMKTAELADITLDRLELATPAEMCRRNSIHNLPPALADIARLRGKLNKAINRKTKDLAT